MKRHGEVFQRVTTGHWSGEKVLLGAYEALTKMIEPASNSMQHDDWS